MSLIYITNHDESIYKAVQKQATDAENVVRSKLDANKLTQRHSTNRYSTSIQQQMNSENLLLECGFKQHGTMGLAVEPLPDPKNYLKKRTGLERYTGKKPAAQRHICTGKKPKIIPNAEEIRTFDRDHNPACKSIEDFVLRNIRRADELQPKKPQHRIVDENHGNYQEYGLQPIYIHAKYFGKTPKYLRGFIEERQKLYQKRKDEAGTEQPKYQYITREEREKILNGLKHNWDELQKEYQTLPILTDTIPKKNRKSKIEADLKQLEKDIVLVERHPYIYVYNNT